MNLKDTMTRYAGSAGDWSDAYLTGESRRIGKMRHQVMRAREASWKRWVDNCAF